MAVVVVTTAVVVFVVLTYVAWRRYLWVAKSYTAGRHLPIQLDRCLWRLPPRERTASERNSVAR